MNFPFLLSSSSCRIGFDEYVHPRLFMSRRTYVSRLRTMFSYESRYTEKQNVRRYKNFGMKYRIVSNKKAWRAETHRMASWTQRPSRCILILPERPLTERRGRRTCAAGSKWKREKALVSPNVDYSSANLFSRRRRNVSSAAKWRLFNHYFHEPEIRLPNCQSKTNIPKWSKCKYVWTFKRFKDVQC